MEQWIIQNSATVFSALVGVFGALVGVIISTIIENKRRRKEEIAKAKPIIINYNPYQISNQKSTTKIFFSSDGKKDDSISIVSTFKNTDNGIAFFDVIETETKKYYPRDNSTVDKNTVFYIFLTNIEGESLKKCMIHCHDIFGTPYCYVAEFRFNQTKDSQIHLISDTPYKGKKKKRHNS